jgi:hypothetical protein
MSSRSPLPASLAIELLTRLATYREQLRVAAEQLRQSRADEDASRIAQETATSSRSGSKAFESRPPALSDRHGTALRAVHAGRINRA